MKGAGSKTPTARGCTVQPLFFSAGKCDICLAEGPVAYIRQLDRFYCSQCLKTAAELIMEVEVKG